MWRVMGGGNGERTGRGDIQNHAAVLVTCSPGESGGGGVHEAVGVLVGDIGNPPCLCYDGSSNIVGFQGAFEVFEFRDGEALGVDEGEDEGVIVCEGWVGWSGHGLDIGGTVLGWWVWKGWGATAFLP